MINLTSLMGALTGLFVLLYLVVIVAVGIYVLVMISRFVKAHQQGAEALTTIAEKIETRDAQPR